MEYLNNLNNEQLKAVQCVKGPVLILAGAGSGKTTVLVNRIAYILDELKESPYRILAITFTNKAANEMKERIRGKIGNVADTMWIGTFHSICVKILRSTIDTIGYGKNFIIYDSTDTQAIIRECLKELNVDDKKWSPRAVASAISRAKDELITPEIFRERYQNDFRMRVISDVYEKYQTKLKNNNALDFDDIIINTVRVLSENPDICFNYGQRFRYIMVDEYQDTNNAQYMLISLLAREYRNLCVVGDDDQSIYKFRGANIRNILDFEKEFPDALTIRLEQNYRSTQNILNAANAVIANNSERKGKNLWTDKGEGEKLHYTVVETEHDEGQYIADTVKELVESGMNYSDIAILYRKNAQSRVIEKKLDKNEIPYRVLAGLRFYDRKEIKDVIAYLRVIYNLGDDVSLKRIINVPKRGIGQTTIEKITSIAEKNGISFFDVLNNSGEYPEISKSQAKLESFSRFILRMKELYDNEGLYELISAVIDQSGYMSMVTELDEQEKTTRKENIEELVNAVKEFVDDEETEGTLDEFLERTALISDVDNYDSSADAVVMMTMHSAKGLEFPVVFLPGMENDTFPGGGMLEEEELEEERRLCYVAITRAKERLYLSGAEQRMIFGRTTFMRESMFISEIPDEYIKKRTREKRKSLFSYMSEHIKSDNKIPKISDAFISKPKPDSNGNTFKTGDRIKHPKFGAGTVISAMQFGNDSKLEISFDTGETKTLMSTFAKIVHLD